MPKAIPGGFPPAQGRPGICSVQAFLSVEKLPCHLPHPRESSFDSASTSLRASLVAQMVKNPLVNAGEVCSITGSRRSPGGGNGNPLQYSCLKNPMDRGAWWAIVVATSQTRLSD